MAKTLQITLPQWDWKRLFSVKTFLLALLVASGVYWWREIRPVVPLDDGVLRAATCRIVGEGEGLLQGAMPEEGALFQKGDLLFSLEKGGLTQKKAQFLAQGEPLAQEKQKLEQTMEKYAQMLLQAPAEIDKILLDVQIAQQNIDRIEREHQQLHTELTAFQMQQRPFTAPFDGIVLQRWKQPGEKVSPGESIFLLCNRQERWIEAKLSEKWLAQATVGTPAQIEFSAVPAQVWKGKLSWISPVAENGEILVRISVENLPLQPGLRAKVSLRLN